MSNIVQFPRPTVTVKLDVRTAPLCIVTTVRDNATDEVTEYPLALDTETATRVIAALTTALLLDAQAAGVGIEAVMAASAAITDDIVARALAQLQAKG